ncbi:type-F conjugative transfer system protein TraW [Scandinavium goeteborgense]|uniref:Conjugal transfer pilus assembly protein TraW n=1 Tax=Scandinavium goeteborgense TaxID=1851514 RepID=A0A4R6E1A7_SCAGO|nr:type-F conjugative transfer system protein TraW [Scandinavium goeteborgense]TDN51491.1 conjugal transfer pilus assembly protein TraW [Scandinavium goeteborgense]
MKRNIIIILVLVAWQSYARDLGSWGALWPVAEPDMLTTIHDKLLSMQDSGEIASTNKAFRERVREHSLRPQPVDGLTVAQENTTHFVDPSFVVSRDIADQNGIVFAHKGEMINPLEHVPFTETLYFIDADSPGQVAWMKAQQPPTLMFKVILVNGNIQEATRALDTHIYFDQKGTLSRRFELTAVPARVTLAPDGKRLQVDTFAVDKEVQ